MSGVFVWELGESIKQNPLYLSCSGEQLWSQPLPAAPVPWGMALDRTGHVIVALVYGQVLAIGKK